MIDFATLKTIREETILIGKIASRALELHIPRKRMDLIMDLEAAHNACPLLLGDLLAADSSDFIHDVSGIIRYLDRDTGALTECFLPRYAAAF